MALDPNCSYIFSMVVLDGRYLSVLGSMTLKELWLVWEKRTNPPFSTALEMGCAMVEEVKRMDASNQNMAACASSSSYREMITYDKKSI